MTMAFLSAFGAISETHNQTSVEWRVPDYFQLCHHRADTFLQSPIFQFAKASWCLRIYPNGVRSTGTVEWVGLHLLQLNSEGLVSVTYTLGIKSYNNGIYHQSKDSNFFRIGHHSMFGFPFFVRRAQMMRDRYQITADEILRIFCIASSNMSLTDGASQTESDSYSSSLTVDLQSLLQSEHKSDVVIKVKDQSFRVHKLILGARSPVFRAMFEHNMKENSSGLVHLEDCNPDTFKEFLLFIYTGNIETLSSKNIFELYTLSDKYDLSDFRKMCVQFMKDNMNLDMVCDVMSIADKHNEIDLKAAAKKFIISNIKTLIPTVQWISFMGENPSLASELLMAAIPSMSS